MGETCQESEIFAFALVEYCPLPAFALICMYKSGTKVQNLTHSRILCVVFCGAFQHGIVMSQCDLNRPGGGGKGRGQGYFLCTMPTVSTQLLFELVLLSC